MQIDNQESTSGQSNQREAIDGLYVDSYKQYMLDIGNPPRLSKDREHLLARNFQEGMRAREVKAAYLALNGIHTFFNYEPLIEAIVDPKIRAGKEARDEILRANLLFVVSRAKRFQGRGLPLVDIIQNGNIGLMRGVDKFDPRRGTRLSTYAQHWIDVSIKRGFEKQARSIRLTHEDQNRLDKVRAINNRLYQDLHRWPTEEEIADIALEPLEDVRRLLQVQEIISIDQEVGRLSGSNTLSDFLSDRTIPSTEEQALQQIEVNKDDALIKKRLYDLAELTARERQVMDCLRPDESGKQPTQRQVAKIIGTNHQYVSRVLKKAISKLERVAREVLDEAS